MALHDSRPDPKCKNCRGTGWHSRGPMYGYPSYGHPCNCLKRYETKGFLSGLRKALDRTGSGSVELTAGTQKPKRGETTE